MIIPDFYSNAILFAFFLLHLIVAFLKSRAMKPNSYSKLYAHLVFSPKGRTSLLTDSIRVNVHKYIYGIISEKKCYPVAINGTKDHIHILTGFHPSIAISDLIRDIKRSSSLFINSNKNSFIKFSWQEGFGAFTVGFRELEILKEYIMNQEDHHNKAGFREEYFKILGEEGIDFDKEYVFEFYDEPD